jgi:hypothetical protein
MLVTEDTLTVGGCGMLLTEDNIIVGTLWDAPNRKYSDSGQAVVCPYIR